MLRKLTLFLCMTDGAAQASPFTILMDSPSLDTLGYNNCDMRTNGELLITRKLIKNNHVVFDVGANEGEWSNHVLRHHRQVKIWAFEPIPALFNKLKDTFAKKPVALHQYAISRDMAIKIFDYYPKNSGLSGLYDRPILLNLVHEQPLKLTVQTISLDEFCKKENIVTIDFLKIDTEGSEYDVLYGAQNLLQQHAIKKIQFEYGGAYLDAKVTLKQVYELLSHYGYSIYRIVPQGLVYIATWRDALENFQYANYIASTKKLS